MRVLLTLKTKHKIYSRLGIGAYTVAKKTQIYTHKQTVHHTFELCMFTSNSNDVVQNKTQTNGGKESETWNWYHLQLHITKNGSKSYVNK